MQTKSGKFIADQSNEEEIVALRKLYERELPTIKEHEIVNAKVLSLHGRHVMLNLKGKADAAVSITEFKDLPELKVGDEVEVYIAEKENKEGDMVVSRSMARLIKSWEMIQDAYENQKVVNCYIKRKIKGGLAVDIENQGIEAFLPKSQINTAAVADLDELVGTTLPVEIININPQKRNAIVSHRMLIEREEEEQRKKIMTSLDVNQIFLGKVKHIADFGTFVDLGGVVGLIHRTDMSWTKKPRNITEIKEIKDENGEPLFVEGKEIKVVIKEFDKDSGTISLSTRFLLPNPWAKFSEEVKEGSTVKGRIKEIRGYGAFVDLVDYPDVTGLLHVSDISHASYLDHPSEIVSVDEEIDLMVLAMDEFTHDLRLGRKQLLPNPWDVKEVMEKYKVDTIHEGKVRLIVREGAYISLEPGVEGFVYNQNLSWTKKVYNAGDIVKKKDMVKVRILGVNEEKKIFEFGVREVENNPWGTFAETFQAGTVHKGTIHRKVNGGAVVELPYGILTFVNSKDLVKKDKTEVEEGDDLSFMVLNCMPDKELINISHTATFRKKTRKPIDSRKSTGPDKLLNLESENEMSTLGDLEALSKLREELRQKDMEEKKEEKKLKNPKKVKK